MMTDEKIIEKYGTPGDEDNFIIVTLPYEMRLAFPPYQPVNKIRCHKLVENNLLKVFNELLTVYTEPEIKKLGIDLFGGCVNVRLMRGSKTKWSRHSWGIAIDLDPARNGLKTKKPIAQFSKPEYKPMIDIFYKHGFISYGIEKDFDWMHFEINS